jgi:hypothetical protein
MGKVPDNVYDKRGITRVRRRVSPMEQELITLPEHLSSSRYFVEFVLLDL